MSDMDPCVAEYLFELNVLSAWVEDHPFWIKVDDIIVIGTLILSSDIQCNRVDVFKDSAGKVDLHTVDFSFPEAHGTNRELILKQLFYCKIGVSFGVCAGTYNQCLSVMQSLLKLLLQN